MAEKQAPHIEQALAEAAGATNEEQIKAANKRLAATGHLEAAKARADAAGSEHKEAPKGRSTRQDAKGSTA